MSHVPQRILQHEIDTEACKIVCMSFDRTWEIRDLTGRDFGIDKIAERFENGNATGDILLLQIKGTEKSIDDKNPRISIPTKTLQYAEMFSSPFLLLFCSLSGTKCCYYLWLQEYINVRLNYDIPKWRKQETVTVYFPTNNKLSASLAIVNLEFIAKYPKYKDAWLQYYLTIEPLEYDLASMCFHFSPCEFGNEDMGERLQAFIDVIKSISIKTC